MGGRLDHVNIAAPDAEELARRFSDALGMQVVKETVVEEQGVKVIMLDAGGAHLEITEPLGPETPVGRFLAKRGSGLHHIAVEVPDIDAALSRMKEQGIALIDETPRIGAMGHRIAFVHPKSFGGVLVEIVEGAKSEED
jgi:methylmalonyl-CoA/ethylmalonyl-CoA epimerase